MTVKVLDNGSAGVLVLLLPFAFCFVILYKFWYLILLLAAVIVGFKIWQNYQWQKWCEDINPYFNQLIKENRGYLTPVDLSLKANLTARNAKIFLTRKSDEYGIEPKNVKDKGMVYYFPTASALGSILDDSEPEPAVNSYQLAAKEANKISVRGIAQLAKQEQQANGVNGSQATATVPRVTQESSPATATIEPKTKLETETTVDSDLEAEYFSLDAGQALIQAELAKRLDLNTSTVGRRKSDPDFEEWSQSKDPEGIAWRYDPDTKLFVAVVSN